MEGLSGKAVDRFGGNAEVTLLRQAQHTWICIPVFAIYK